jgi:hypothetical protein
VSQTRLRLAVVAIALVPLVAYPLVVQAAGGHEPAFPGSRAECARPASGSGDEPVEVVAGHVDSVADAERLLARARAHGGSSMRVEEDGCGRWKVTSDAGSYVEARATADALAAAGVAARVEIDPTPSG